MNPKKILIVSARPAGIDSWPGPYDTVFVQDDESAIEVAQRQDFEAIVLDGTDAGLHTAKLRAILPILQPDAALFQYSGDGGSSVQAEVREYFRQQRNDRVRRFIVFDDVNRADWSEELPTFSAN